MFYEESILISGVIIS